MFKMTKNSKTAVINLNSPWTIYSLLKYGVNVKWAASIFCSDYILLWMWAVKGRDEMTWADGANDRKNSLSFMYNQ